MLIRKIVFVFYLGMIASCKAQPKSLPTPISALTVSPTAIVNIASTSNSIPATSTPFVCNQDWQSLLIIPKFSDVARKLYQEGIVNGNNPHSFSKIGDGEISTEWFLTDFDLGTEHYRLGDYQNLSS